MSPEVRTALLVAGGIAVAGLLTGAITNTPPTDRDGSDGGRTGVWISDDLQPGLAQPSTMPNVLSRRHPLYRRPSHPRPALAELCTRGWGAWMIRPPSEEG